MLRHLGRSIKWSGLADFTYLACFSRHFSAACTRLRASFCCMLCMLRLLQAAVLNSMGTLCTLRTRLTVQGHVRGVGWVQNGITLCMLSTQPFGRIPLWLPQSRCLAANVGRQGAAEGGLLEGVGNCSSGGYGLLQSSRCSFPPFRRGLVGAYGCCQGLLGCLRLHCTCTHIQCLKTLHTRHYLRLCTKHFI